MGALGPWERTDEHLMTKESKRTVCAGLGWVLQSRNGYRWSPQDGELEQGRSWHSDNVDRSRTFSFGLDWSLFLGCHSDHLYCHVLLQTYWCKTTTFYSAHRFRGSGILEGHSGDSSSLPHDVWGLSWDDSNGWS